MPTSTVLRRTRSSPNLYGDVSTLDADALRRFNEETRWEADFEPETTDVFNLEDPNANGGRIFREVPSEAMRKWETKKAGGSSNVALDKLMQLVGLEKVKEEFLQLKDWVEVARRQRYDMSDERFNAVFTGNPGTGKTTVARIYAEFLQTSGLLKIKGTESKKVTTQGSEEVLPKNSSEEGNPDKSHTIAFAEIAGGTLLKLGIEGANAIIEEIVSGGGGVIFVDEAQDLVDAEVSTGSGSEMINYLMTAMDKYNDKVAFVFAGYAKDMESFMETNPGLQGRIPYKFKFEDFTDEELWMIIKKRIRDKYHGRMRIEGGEDGLYMRIAIRRLGRGRGNRGFANARSVQNLVSLMARRQAARVQREREEAKPSDLYLRKEDIIGPDPSKVGFISQAYRDLHSLVGLERVKTEVDALMERMEANYRRELAEQKPLDVPLNRVFYGAPGTGKTTVAKLFGRILTDLGLLSKGDVVVKNPADFIGACLGKSERQTKTILANTLGSVLIIDEAYMLDNGGPGKEPDNFRTAVIDTIVAEVQSNPGDDRCVILLGYEDKMKDMFRNVNPGLSRRFDSERPFRFDNFTAEQLITIFERKMASKDLSTTTAGIEVVSKVLQLEKKRPNFGNGGAVENLISTANTNYLSRQAVASRKGHNPSYDGLLLPQDFDRNYKRFGCVDDSVFSDLFRDLVNCNHVKEHLQRQYKAGMRLVAGSKNQALQDLMPFNFVFTAKQPGTGMRTVTRRLGKLYYSLGLLPEDTVIERTAADFIGMHVGHTAQKTRQQLEGALGKVLLIDEPYRIMESGYGVEAISEIRNFLRKHKQQLVVVFRGFANIIDRFLKTHALINLFPREGNITFKDFGPADCIEILIRLLKERNIQAPFLEKDGKDRKAAEQMFLLLTGSVIWSNMRDMEDLADSLSRHVASKLEYETESNEEWRYGSHSDLSGQRGKMRPHIITIDDLQLYIKEMYDSHLAEAVQIANAYGIQPKPPTDEKQTTSSTQTQPCPVSTEVETDSKTCPSSKGGKGECDTSAGICASNGSGSGEPTGRPRIRETIDNSSETTVRTPESPSNDSATVPTIAIFDSELQAEPESIIEESSNNRAEIVGETSAELKVEVHGVTGTAEEASKLQTNLESSPVSPIELDKGMDAESISTSTYSGTDSTDMTSPEPSIFLGQELRPTSSSNTPSINSTSSVRSAVSAAKASTRKALSKAGKTLKKPLSSLNLKIRKKKDEEEAQRKAEAEKKLEDLGPCACINGYAWQVNRGGGRALYRCEGGYHTSNDPWKEK